MVTVLIEYYFYLFDKQVSKKSFKGENVPSSNWQIAALPNCPFEIPIIVEAKRKTIKFLIIS